MTNSQFGEDCSRESVSLLLSFLTRLHAHECHVNFNCRADCASCREIKIFSWISVIEKQIHRGVISYLQGHRAKV